MDESSRGIRGLEVQAGSWVGRVGKSLDCWALGKRPVGIVVDGAWKEELDPEGACSILWSL